MKLILLEGSPASGKSTLGERIVEMYGLHGCRAILLDHDIYIDGLFPGWFSMSRRQQEAEIMIARNKHLIDINKNLTKGFIVVAIGGIWLTKDDVGRYVEKLVVKTRVFLFHLNVPLEVLKQRESRRGHNPLIDLDKRQKIRDAISSWPGYVYQNVNTPDEDAQNLLQLIEDRQGLVY